METRSSANLPPNFSPLDALLLERQSVLCLAPGSDNLPDLVMQALDINLAQIGFALSSQLSARLRTLSPAGVEQIWNKALPVLLAKVGGGQKHVPLLRHFPHGIPHDTTQLWVRKVLNHFAQASNQPCLFCHREGSTHVMNPCHHVVCDVCFDGSNYSACPVCGKQVDTSSPFFQAVLPRQPGKESMPLKLLHLGGTREQHASALLRSLCERKQALSPEDRAALKLLVQEMGASALSSLPATIAVRENVALVFGTLLQQLDAASVMQAAQAHFNSATDVLRLLAAYSGVDPALQGETVYRIVPTTHILASKRYRAMHANWKYLQRQPQWRMSSVVKRFKLAKLARPLRRAVLGFMETLAPAQLTEDMLRHRSYWVWLGEFLHPHEYQKRFPAVAKAFAIVRKKAPDGTRAPAFAGYYSRMEQAIRTRDALALAQVLRERAGEFGRRLDLALRLSQNEAEQSAVLATFLPCAAKLSTPVLLTLRALLPTRLQPAKKRLYWPKGGVSKCVMADDERPVLSKFAVQTALAAVEQALLERFAAKGALPHMVIDSALASIIAPFNERTASRSAIQLPRGSTLALPAQKYLRLFLHWCEPRQASDCTDLDLSVGFYDANWQYLGVCSYYQLEYRGKNGQRIAASAGDLTSAPWPNGASEFVDIDLDTASTEGIRYCVAVLNNYSGQAFEELERAFAGLMYRDDLKGLHFDPRTVALRFDLAGKNGVFLPLVIDLAQQQMHWLDMYATGGFEFNNVATSNDGITTICPTMMAYFASGTRTTMLDLALLHAAARGGQVWLRGENSVLLEREAGEDHGQFLARLRQAQGQAQASMPFGPECPVWAALDHGDLVLPEGSTCYALRPGSSVASMAAADLLV